MDVVQSPTASGSHFLLPLLSAGKAPEAESLCLEQEHRSAQAVEVNLNFLTSRTKQLKCLPVAVLTSCSTCYLCFSAVLLGIVLSFRGGRGRMPASASESWAWALYCLEWLGSSPAVGALAQWGRKRAFLAL